MSELDFTAVSFLSKEAAPLINARRFYNLKDLFSPSEKALEKVVPRQGKFVTDVAEQAGAHNGEGMRLFDRDEIMARRRKEMDHEGTGSLFGDAFVGTANFLTPKSWGVKEKAQNALYKMKEGITAADTKAGAALAGSNPTGMRGRLFSSKTGHKGQGIQIGEKTNADGSTSPLMEGTGMDRRPSLIAPVQNGMQMATPFLAATYVADKLYPRDQQPNEKMAFSADEYLSKVAQKKPTNAEETGILVDERIAWGMEKQASLIKFAELQDELEKTASLLKQVSEESQLFEKQAHFERSEKEKVAGLWKEAREQLIEKKAESEEFRLRTVARERSKIAVDLAEGMVTAGLIKQAQVDSQIDKLMECDEETFNLYSSMVKQASKGEEGLETLAFLGDYSSNELDSTLSPPVRGLSKSGQSMGEAARELLNK